MNVDEAVDEVARWCARETAAGNPDVEVVCHGMVFITIGEASPPWHVRWERRSSGGASAPVAQLRFDAERGDWALHHGAAPAGWCSHEDAIHARELGPLLDVIAADRTGRFEGLPPVAAGLDPER
jgi:hypothetical protein